MHFSMMSLVHWLCITLAWVVMYSIDVKKDVTVFRQCAQEEHCDSPIAEWEPYGSLLCFDKCLQLASCSHVRFNSKTLVCRICSASDNVPSGEPQKSQSDEDWSCRRKPSLVLSSEGQRGSRCVKSRSGETKRVPYDLQEHLQKKARMSTQPRKYTPLINITERDLRDNWTTTKIQGPYIIMKSLTWSPSFANEFYILSIRELINFIIDLYILKGNSLEKHVQWDSVLLPIKPTIPWSTIDTGPCLTNDSLSCIYAFRMRSSFAVLEMHLRSYREVKSPRHLELEREGVITHNLPKTMVRCAFACSVKFGMAIYFQGDYNTPVKKYLIHAGKGALTLTESGTINGTAYVKRIKWNYDGSFALAMSNYNLYLIRHLDDKEEVVVKARHKWNRYYALVWTNTSILVLEIGPRGKALRIRSLKF